MMGANGKMGDVKTNEKEFLCVWRYGMEWDGWSNGHTSD